MRSLRIINKWIIAAFLAGSAMAVHAVPITGSIQMGGLVQTVNNSGPTTLGLATGLAFQPIFPNNSTMMVYLATGDFASPVGSHSRGHRDAAVKAKFGIR